MRDGGKVQAAIEVLRDVLERRTPVKEAVRDWGKKSRFAGARDRAWISGLVVDALRRKNSIEFAMEATGPRVLALGALKHAWGWDVRKIEEALKDEHAPPPLQGKERENLLMAPNPVAPPHVQGDFPEWLTPNMLRAFGQDAVPEGMAMAARAPIDLRVNTLKSDPEKAGRALEGVKAKAMPELVNGFRIPAADSVERGESVEAIPAYSKGWVEVQDMGSQIAAAASCAAPGEQVLDYCAGGGGKTLALAAAMQGEGRLMAWDANPRRMADLPERARRAGATVRILTDAERAALRPICDLVLVDAPCSGTGAWRRKPDSKWRLTVPLLASFPPLQDGILDAAAAKVRPGGALVYATCSLLLRENEARARAFLERHPGWTPESARRLSPLDGGDGFFFARFRAPKRRVVSNHSGTKDDN